MKNLSQQEYDRLVSDAALIERDHHGPKVLKAADGSFIKLFRRKHLLTTALLWPYAQRFADNAGKLRLLGIPSVDMLDLAYCPGVQRHLVRYRPLPGRTLREVAAERGLDPCHLAGFLAELHGKGVFFRSIHLGNIIVDPQSGAFGLIDVADLKISRRGLSRRKRLRNFRHMLRYREDVALLCRAGFEPFVDAYIAASGLTALAEPMRKELSPLCAGA